MFMLILNRHFKLYTLFFILLIYLISILFLY